MNKSGYIYLIQLREFIRLNENIYKIGRTEQYDPLDRIKGYPKKSKVILIKQCLNDVKTELLLINIFKDKYIQHTEYGREYFEGNYKDMVKDIEEIINSQDANNVLVVSSQDDNNVLASNTQNKIDNIETKTNLSAPIKLHCDEDVIYFYNCINRNNKLKTRIINTCNNIKNNEEIMDKYFMYLHYELMMLQNEYSWILKDETHIYYKCESCDMSNKSYFDFMPHFVDCCNKSQTNFNIKQKLMNEFENYHNSYGKYINFTLVRNWNEFI